MYAVTGVPNMKWKETHWPPASDSPESSTFCEFAEVAHSTWAMSRVCYSLSKTVILNLFAKRSQIQTYKLVRGPH